MDTLTLGRLIQVISVDRFATYLSAAGGDYELGLALYRWNIAVSACFMGPVQMLEVALRNRLHDALADARRRSDWWNDPNLALTEVHQRMIVAALDKAGRGGRAFTAGHVVAELSFGFWVGLLGPGRAYEERLWRPILRHALPGYRGTRRDLHQDLDRRRTFRNRLAHHEPVFQRNLQAERDHILRLTRIIEPAAADWLVANSRVDQVLTQRPTVGRLQPCLF